MGKGSSSPLLHLHLQHSTNGVARSRNGEATSKRRPKPAKIPTTCGETDENVNDMKECPQTKYLSKSKKKKTKKKNTSLKHMYQVFLYFLHLCWFHISLEKLLYHVQDKFKFNVMWFNHQVKVIMNFPYKLKTFEYTHTHKLNSIKSRDFYSFHSFFIMIQGHPDFFFTLCPPKNITMNFNSEIELYFSLGLLLNKFMFFVVCIWPL